MRKKNIPNQFVLPQFCDGCFYKLSNRCDGATNLRTYELLSKAFVGCANENKAEFIRDIIQRQNAPKSSNQSKLSFSTNYISQVIERKRIPIIPLNDRIVAISLTTFLDKNGRLKYKDKKALTYALGIDENSKIALIGTCNDPRIEEFWAISEVENLWQKIAEFGFEFVTGLTFSVYEIFPLFSQKYNQDRNFLSHDIFSSLGVPCIPFLMPSDEKDYKYISTWLGKRQDVRIVAIYGSSYTRSAKEFRKLIERLQKLNSISPKPLKFMIIGVAKPDQLQIILSEFDAIIVNPKASMQAIKAGNRIDEKLNEISAREFTNDELIIPNIEAIEKFCMSLSK